MSSALTPLEVFCSYAQKDESLLQELEVHLSSLKRQGLNPSKQTSRHGDNLCYTTGNRIVVSPLLDK